ncbi:MAG TPA: beta-N-acetylglucosaminidase, partial [Flavobacterium sp.]|nr:beta-N-acetylglucosaminidase [Flavobacterium sp.]
HKPIEINNLYHDINKPDYEALNYQLFENAITTLQNINDIIPIKVLKNEKIAYVKIGDDSHDAFLNHLREFTDVSEITSVSIDTILSKLQDFDKVIIGFHKADNIWKKNNPTSEEIRWINSISKQKPTILAFFSRPYSVTSTINFSTLDGFIMAYQNNKFTQQLVPDIIFGSNGSKGKLPVSINEFFKVSTGLKTNEINRLGFNSPENVGIDAEKLAGIDSIVLKAINEKMTPGAQVVIARKGNVIYQKSFGTHTYNDTIKVKNTDLYDVASLTKILATLPSLMQIYDKGVITLDTPLKEMLPVFKKSNKENKTLLEMLSHQAGFQAWEAFYLKTLDKEKRPNPLYYRQTFSKEFPNKVAENLYLRHDFNDTIINSIVKSKLLPTNEYKYSDFSFIILKEYIERHTKKKLNVLVEENFYSQMGMNHTTYNPLEKFSLNQIIPTEEDNYFRYQTI